jgi:hypothetical protein
MPQSRKRRPARPADKLRERRRRRERQRQQRPSRPPAGTDECLTLSGPEIHAQLEELITSEDRQAFSDHVDAAAAGDPALAAACLRRGIVVQGTPHLAQLQELVDLADEAPSWALGRWVCDQAYRWMLHEHDPRTDQAVIDVIASCYPDVDLDRPLGLSLTEFGTRIAAGDWIAQQLAIYEAGGLDDFLDVKISDVLLDRSGPVHRWSATRLGGYRIDGTRDGALLLTDLRDGSARTALDIGAWTGRGPGCTVLGRLVPIDVEPGWFFESRPIEVDPVTAREVASADGVDAWLDALWSGRTAGRLPRHFAHVTGTPLTSDIEPMDGWGRSCSHPQEQAPSPTAAPAIRALQEAGLDPLRANNIGVCDVALIAAEVSPETLAAVGCSLQAVLVDRRTFEAARVHRTAPHHAAAWRALAGVVPEPVRSRCLELADLSGRSAA